MRAGGQFVAVVFTLCAARAAAQSDATPPHVRTFDDGDAASTSASFGSSVVIEAGDADSQATISISDFLRRNSGKTVRYGFRASAPFDSKKSDSVDVGTLSGLNAGTSLTGDFTWVDWEGPDADDQRKVSAFCNDLVPQLIPGYDRNVVNALGDWHCAPDGFTVDKISAAVGVLNTKRAACISNPPPAGSPEAVVCAPLVSRKQAELSPNATALLAGAPQRLTALIDDTLTPVRLWTIAAKTNQQRFEFILPAAPTETLKEQKRGWGATIAFTRMSRRLLWSAGVSHEKSYSASDRVDVCSPIGTTGSTSCVEAHVGAPTTKETEIAFGELRWLLPARKLAISPRLEFDTDDSEWALRFPMYLVQNRSGAFTAGLAVGYGTKDDDVGLAVFVGKEFSFFD